MARSSILLVALLLGLVSAQVPQFFRIGPNVPGPNIPVGGTLFLPSESSDPSALSPALTTDTQLVQITGLNLGGILSFDLGRPTTGAPGPNQPCTLFAAQNLGINYDEVDYTTAPIVVVPPPPPNTVQFFIPGSGGNPPPGENWISQKLEIASVPVALCYTVDGANFLTTGFSIAVAWDCLSGDANRDCAQYESTTNTDAGYESLTIAQRQAIRAATQCCKANTGLGVGVCINPNTQSCCGGQPFNGQTQQCCNAAQQRVSALGVPCTCSGTPSGTFLNTDVIFPLYSPQDAVCPTGQRCCLPSKYPELANTFAFGNCYDPEVRRCCDTGLDYDPGTTQCCTINGPQSVDIPCPCSSDAHCTGGQFEYKNTHSRCCVQTEPTPRETATQNCNIYANAPTTINSALTGAGLAVDQRCLGACIDTRYQICCNGVSCILEYERCCNATCCNKFSQTCDFGERTNTPGNPFNNNNFRVIFMHCSTIEQLNPPRAVLIFVLPLFLMLLTLFSFAVAIVFANKATTRSYSGLEIVIILTAIGAGIFALSLYFSPMWKYGLFIVIVCILSFLAAAARVFYFNVLVLALQILAILYIFDPFHGSRYLVLATLRDPATAEPLPCSYGLFHTTQCMADEGSRLCRSYYDYFGYDPLLRDTDRFENPEVQAWGYCDRHWFTTLLIFEVVIMVFLIVLFLLTLLGLLLRFRPLLPEPVQLEIVKEQPEVIYPMAVAPYPVM